MHVEGHIESGSGYSSGGGTSSGPRRTNRTPIGSTGTDMGSGMMGDPTMGGGMMMGMVQSDGSTMTPMGLRPKNIILSRKPDIKNWTESTIPDSSGQLKIRARKNEQGDTYIYGDGFSFLVLDNKYYPRDYDIQSGDCYGYVFDNGNVVLYTWKSGPHNSPPPCGY